jgi:hypothetical protein
MNLSAYFLHLIFEGAATVGGYYARGFCKHPWHRWLLGFVWSLVATAALVAIVG